MKPDAGITALGAKASPGLPLLRRFCSIRADLGPAVEFTTTRGTRRAMFPITGGAACGEGWTARILPGGADFAVGYADGSYDIAARYLLEMADGTLVMVQNAGRMLLQADGSYHGRTRAALEVPDGPRRAMADMVLFGTALAEAGDDDHVYIELWEAPV
jgi:hypothetical protein